MSIQANQLFFYNECDIFSKNVNMVPYKRFYRLLDMYITLRVIHFLELYYL